jgi:UDP-N-acetyl-D-glucosamine dehydrogenase
MTQKVVVIGLGYVGLPLAQAATLAGLEVTGLDLNTDLVHGLMSGTSHVDDLSDADISEMLTRGFSATCDASCIETASVVVICVPTPLSQDGGPDLGAVRGATKSIANKLKSGTLVILESTTYPGTTEEVVLPILEESGLKLGEFDLAFSPERIDPGNATYGITNTPKVVGGVNQTSGDKAVGFYNIFVEHVVRAKGAKEAEMAKLLENTYRHVNIALMNELVELSHMMGIDLWNAIDCAATKPFGYQAFYPGPGVGGHCIPIDPNYLSHHVKLVLGRPFRFVELAQEINAGMPSYVVRRAQDILNETGNPLRGTKILLIGVTYKADIADQRESPVRPIAQELLSKGVDLKFYDPFVENWNVDSEHHATIGDRILSSVKDPYIAAKESDLVIVLQHHASIDFQRVVNSGSMILDTRGNLTGERTFSL